MVKTRYFEFKSVSAKDSTNYTVNKANQELFKEEFGKLVAEFMSKPVKKVVGFYYRENSNQFFFVWQYEG